LTITFSMPGTSGDADLLLDPTDRDELVQRLRERQLNELADRVAEPDALIIELEPQWCSPLDAIANLWLNDGAPDHLRDGLAHLQAVLALNHQP
jgi:hypothetical protein